MQMIKLKNGTEEAAPLVMVTNALLKNLWNSGIGGLTTVSDLVQICRRDPKYSKFGENEEVLKQLKLLQPDGQPHNSIRNIVLSSFTGEGLNLEFVSPIAK